ncbi:alpha/beta fold hydrolase [Soonwooa sp.]|uniref:alpha/beta hydrolase family protein n=1 Tax=Soonwooa sp. TaxID=1938592 RepID=UPI002621EC81|nr:alpha/beta fold hydrolase [Soonwooa sp.]
MKKLISLSILGLFALTTSCENHPKNLAAISQSNFDYKSISFPSKDNKIRVYADYYANNSKNAPLILAFHQAGSSRGVYRDIAPRLVALGFNVLAVDLRSGHKFGNVTNESFQEAYSKNLPTEFENSIPDIEASYDYAKNILKAKKVIYFGSSYSASLGFYTISQHPTDYAALVTFSPGEYFKIDNKSIADFAKDDNIPTFVSSAKDEKPNWLNIYNSVSSPKKQEFLPTNWTGYHGEVTLSGNFPKAEEYWVPLTKFLKTVK